MITNKIQSGFTGTTNVRTEERFLGVTIAGKKYAIEMNKIVTVLELKKLIKSKTNSPFFLGYLKIGTILVPVADIKYRLENGEKDWNSRPCVVLVSLHGWRIGIITDNIPLPIFIAKNDIIHRPSARTAINSLYLKGIGRCLDDVKPILNLENILTIKDIKEMGI